MEAVANRNRAIPTTRAELHRMYPEAGAEEALPHYSKVELMAQLQSANQDILETQICVLRLKQQAELEKQGELLTASIDDLEHEECLSPLSKRELVSKLESQNQQLAEAQREMIEGRSKASKDRRQKAQEIKKATDKIHTLQEELGQQRNRASESSHNERQQLQRIEALEQELLQAQLQKLELASQVTATQAENTAVAEEIKSAHAKLSESQKELKKMEEVCEESCSVARKLKEHVKFTLAASDDCSPDEVATWLEQANSEIYDVQSELLSSPKSDKHMNSLRKARMEALDELVQHNRHRLDNVRSSGEDKEEVKQAAAMSELLQNKDAELAQLKERLASQSDGGAKAAKPTRTKLSVDTAKTGTSARGDQEVRWLQQAVREKDLALTAMSKAKKQAVDEAALREQKLKMALMVQNSSNAPYSRKANANTGHSAPARDRHVLEKQVADMKRLVKEKEASLEKMSQEKTRKLNEAAARERALLQKAHQSQAGARSHGNGDAVTRRLRREAALSKGQLQTLSHENEQLQQKSDQMSKLIREKESALAELAEKMQQTVHNAAVKEEMLKLALETRSKVDPPPSKAIDIVGDMTLQSIIQEGGAMRRTKRQERESSRRIEREKGISGKQASRKRPGSLRHTLKPTSLLTVGAKARSKQVEQDAYREKKFQDALRDQMRKEQADAAMREEQGLYDDGVAYHEFISDPNSKRYRSSPNKNLAYKSLAKAQQRWASVQAKPRSSECIVTL